MDNLPVYTARILDVVEWSPAGWCMILLRLPELAVPLIVDELCLKDPRALYPIGTDVSFTLGTTAWKAESTQDVARLEYAWDYDLTSFLADDFPIVPGSRYTFHGRVQSVADGRLLLDCGLVLSVRPARHLTFPEVALGDLLCVTGHLSIQRQEAPAAERPGILRHNSASQ